VPRINAESVTAHRALMASRLLDAVGEVLAERGYAELTLAEVAARAGMARNSVYGYAKDREALLMAYVERAVARFIEQTRAEVDAAPDAPGRLRVLVHRQMHQFRVEPGAGDSAPGMVQGADLGPEVHARLMALFRPLHDLLAEILAEGMADGSFRRTPIEPLLPLIGACLGAQRLPVGSGQVDPDVAAGQVTDFVLHALGAS
jgi:AcrR family transcriptional regulator